MAKRIHDQIVSDTILEPNIGEQMVKQAHKVWDENALQNTPIPETDPRSAQQVRWVKKWNRRIREICQLTVTVGWIVSMAFRYGTNTIPTKALMIHELIILFALTSFALIWPTAIELYLGFMKVKE